MAMKIIKADDVRVADLIDEAARSGDSIELETESGRAVLISMSEWNSIRETLYLLSIPGMRESIREGMKTPVDECSDGIDW